MTRDYDSDTAEVVRAPPDWRAEVLRASGLNVLAGAWLVVSPWILNYREADARVMAIVLGGAVALLAFLRLTGSSRLDWLSWVNAAIGLWLASSALWLPDSRRALWNFLVVGVVVFAAAAWSASARSVSGREQRPAR